MARKPAKGEKPLDWIGSSKKDFLGFPEPVKDEMGNALGKEVVYVLHAFQKKSPKGVKTAKVDIELVAKRLKTAQQDYEAHHGKTKHQKAKRS